MTQTFHGTLFAKQLLFSFEGASKPFAKENMLGPLIAYVLTYTAGADDAEVPPVPIPNTEVKLCRAEDSWLETTCKNR